MVTKQMAAINHYMTPELMSNFIQYETDKGASENMTRRFKGAVKVLYDYLPEDKCVMSLTPMLSRITSTSGHFFPLSANAPI